MDWAFGFGLYASYPVEINGNEGTIDLFSHDKALLDKFKNSVVSGDIEKVYGDGNYAMAVYNQSNRLSVGDKIKIGNQELEIACVASEGIGSVSNAPTVVCSEETFTRLTGDCGFVTIGVVLKKDVSETAVKKIANLANGNLFSDNREVNSENSGSYWVFRCSIWFLNNYFLDNRVEYYEQYFHGRVCKSEAIWGNACCRYGKPPGHKDDNSRSCYIRCLRNDCRNCIWAYVTLFDLCENCHYSFWRQLEYPI